MRSGATLRWLWSIEGPLGSEGLFISNLALHSDLHDCIFEFSFCEISGATMRWLRPKEGSPRIRGLIHV